MSSVGVLSSETLEDLVEVVVRRRSFARRAVVAHNAISQGGKKTDREDQNGDGSECQLVGCVFEDYIVGDLSDGGCDR